MRNNISTNVRNLNLSRQKPSLPCKKLPPRFSPWLLEGLEEDRLAEKIAPRAPGMAWIWAGTADTAALRIVDGSKQEGWERERGISMCRRWIGCGGWKNVSRVIYVDY